MASRSPYVPGRYKVLVVEDEPALRDLIAEVLETDGGFTVVEAKSGDDAILLLAQDNGISCVFTDIRMPGMHDGVALARHVREHYPEVKLMMTSGHMQSQDVGEGIPFMAKPYDCWLVSDMIHKLIDQDG